MKKTTALVLALLLVLAAFACSAPVRETKEENSAYGTYELYAMDFEDGVIILAAPFFEGENYITLMTDGDAIIHMGGESHDAKWKQDGAKLALDTPDGDMTATLSEGILALSFEDGNLYFVGASGSKESLHAVSLEEAMGLDTPEQTDPNLPTEQDAEPAGPSELQQLWNGWYFGCIDLDNCTDEWEKLNGSTYDAVMYVELDRDGVGLLAIYDPFGILVGNDQNNIYIQMQCHADEQYLYGDSGTAFNDVINPSDWQFVHNLSIPGKLNVGSKAKEASGAEIGFDFQFRPWGELWDDDSYAQFIPYYQSYVNAVNEGLTCPYGDTFQGFGIAEPLPSSTTADTPAAPSAAPAQSSGEASALLGANPATLDVNDRGIVTVLYPADQFRYDDLYGKLKNDTTGVGILIDPMLGEKNFEELKASYEKNNSDEDEYSLTDTTVNGLKAQILTYSDWLGATMRVDIDFGGNHGGWYGISFAVSGDTLKDCNTELVWAIIRSMSLLK